MKLYSKNEILQTIKGFLFENENGVLELTGPTASGKTGLSIEIAKFVEKELERTPEIICVDSKQVFVDMDISSAKITKEEMQGVIHHGLDIRRPDEWINVVEFQAYGFQLIQDILDRGNIPILCGGTMLWLDAISENYVFGPKGEKSIERIDPRWPFLKIGIHWDRAKLYERCNLRAKKQFDEGLIEETKMILKKYPNISRQSYLSFGYEEIQKYLDGEMTLERALEINQQRNRKYVKRQLTWWRGREDVLWIDGVSL